MTKPTAQPDVIEPRSSATRTPVKAPSIHGRGIRIVADTSTADRIWCVLELDDPNPRGRVRCKVNYTVPQSWPQNLHGAALSVAAHWFRDIGGFQTLRAAPLKHIIQRLRETDADGKPLYTEQMFHIAIDQYAHNDWHKKEKAWTDIGRFFTGEKFLDKWCPRLQPTGGCATAVPAVPRPAVPKPAVPTKRRRLGVPGGSPASALDPNRDRKGVATEPTRSLGPTTIGGCIQEFIPKPDRWAFYTPLSRKADAATKRRAKQRATELIPLLWKHLPDSIRSPLKSRVASHCFKHNLDPEALHRRGDPAFRVIQRDLLLKALRAEYRDPKRLGENLERHLR